MDIATARRLKPGERIRHRTLEGFVLSIMHDWHGARGSLNGIPILLDNSRVLIEWIGSPQTDGMYGWNNRKSRVWITVPQYENRHYKRYWEETEKIIL
ncbi:MAG TPA: hypothetical protein VJK03_02960 [Candidatus Nanoarchaeia archaeon]|nr:hypothetical protein [Candidatus Nanoarchaeia archaeon]